LPFRASQWRHVVRAAALCVCTRECDNVWRELLHEL
jgi:hypothetical protein